MNPVFFFPFIVLLSILQKNNEIEKGMVYAVCHGTSHTLLVIIFCGFTILVNVQKIQFNTSGDAYAGV